MKKSVYRILAFCMLQYALTAGAVAENGFASDSDTGKAWNVVRENEQKSFPKTVPPGNYSGITRLHNDVYAVVSDKSDSALYFRFRIQINSGTGELENVAYLGQSEHIGTLCQRIHRQTPGIVKGGYDHEAIAKVSDSTVVVASEGYCSLAEYPIVDGPGENGRQGGVYWEWQTKPELFYPNYNFESLAYDSLRHRLWTIPESTLRHDGIAATPQNGNANKLRLLCFDWSGAAGGGSARPLLAEYAYRMDAPSTSKSAQTYVMGVSELCALPDGKLLVLEREAFIPKIKLGAFCRCKLYVIDPDSASSLPVPDDTSSMIESPKGDFSENTIYINKVLLTEWTTRLSVFDHSFANYEAMCLGPQLKDGAQVVVLLSDSQDQYAGVLKDYFKTIVIR